MKYDYAVKINDKIVYSFKKEEDAITYFKSQIKLTKDAFGFYPSEKDTISLVFKRNGFLIFN